LSRRRYRRTKGRISFIVEDVISVEAEAKNKMTIKNLNKFIENTNFIKKITHRLGFPPFSMPARPLGEGS
jgi:hypothetical protein